MRKSVRYTLRFLAIAIAMTAISFAVLHFSSRSGGIASASVKSEDITPLTPCDNVACNTGCWSDGVHANHGTFAKKKSPQPPECDPGTGGCQTLSCP